MFLVDPDGTIQAKFAEEGYRTRPDFANVLEAAAELSSPKRQIRLKPGERHVPLSAPFRAAALLAFNYLPN